MDFPGCRYTLTRNDYRLGELVRVRLMLWSIGLTSSCSPEWPDKVSEKQVAMWYRLHFSEYHAGLAGSSDGP